MRKRSSKSNITRIELNSAVEKYLGSGGKVHYLPEQQVYVPHVIGMDKYDFYENVSSFGA